MAKVQPVQRGKNCSGVPIRLGPACGNDTAGSGGQPRAGHAHESGARQYPAAAGAAPIQHDQSDLGRKAGCLDVAQQVDPASRLQAESKHSPALLVVREEHMRRDVKHRRLRSERFRETLLGCRHSLQQRGWEAVSAPNAGACFDFTGASRQTGQFHSRRYCPHRERIEERGFGFAALDDQPRIGAVINRVSRRPRICPARCAEHAAPGPGPPSSSAANAAR